MCQSITQGAVGLPLSFALRPRLRLNSEPVVDGAPKLLLASEVTLPGLDRHVPEEELNLVPFAEVAESGAGATQILSR
jgi:hypothetical protein